jgi:hypothetical protein
VIFLKIKTKINVIASHVKFYARLLVKENEDKLLALRVKEEEARSVSFGGMSFRVIFVPQSEDPELQEMEFQALRREEARKVLLARELGNVPETASREERGLGVYQKLGLVVVAAVNIVLLYALSFDPMGQPSSPLL